MGWNGSGGFTFTYNWVNDKNNGIPITASRMDTQFNDAISGFQNCITRDNQGKPTAHFLPGTNAAYNLGSSAYRWVNGYFSGDISTNGGNVNVAGASLNADSGSGASLTLTGFSTTGTLGTRSFTTTDGSGLSMVCVSNGVILNNGATSWSAISDERRKMGLKPIEDGLAKVSTLRAVTGRYVGDSAETSRSFLIAQDVSKVLPEAVSEGADGYLMLRYNEVIPLLVAALSEAKARIEALEAK